MEDKGDLRFEDGVFEYDVTAYNGPGTRTPFYALRRGKQARNARPRLIATYSGRKVWADLILAYP